MSHPEDPQSTNGPSSRHCQRASLGTSASGFADSTISFNTYATGITEGSLCLSQFPPPPVDLPLTPVNERFLPSPARSTFTIPPPRLATPTAERSPAQSTFTIPCRPSISPVSACPVPSLAETHHKIGPSLPCTEYLYHRCTRTCDTARIHDYRCSSAFRTKSPSC